MPGDGLTHGPPAAKKQAAVTTGSARSTGIPCAVVLRLIRGLPGEPGFLATVTARIAPRDLAPASGRQDHTISPSAEALFVYAAHPRPPQSRLACRDDRAYAPLLEAGWRDEAINSGRK